MTDIEPKGNQLEKIGFKKIGNSDYLHQGELVVRNSSSPEIFVDYDPGTKWEDIVGIKKGDSYGGFSLVITNRDGVVLEKTVNGSGGSYRGEKPRVDDLLNVKISDQLLSQGFEKDSNDPNIFKINFEEYGKNYEVVILLEGGKVKKVLKPIDKRALKAVGEEYEVLGYKESVDSFDRKESIVTVASKFIQVDISSGYGGRALDETQRLLRNVDSSQLGIKPFAEVAEASGFKIGGKNSTELILSLQSINGISIPKLEDRLRPHSYSMSGFIGNGESFLKVLADDNDFVLSKGLTHQKLAEPLIYAREFYIKGMGSSFEYNGIKYEVKVTGYRGSQNSPFDDKTDSSIDMKVTNLSTGKSLSCSGMVPDMIQRYGFYEGKEVSYRLEPSSILQVFDFPTK